MQIGVTFGGNAFGLNFKVYCSSLLIFKVELFLIFWVRLRKQFNRISTGVCRNEYVQYKNIMTVKYLHPEGFWY